MRPFYVVIACLLLSISLPVSAIHNHPSVPFTQQVTQSSHIVEGTITDKVSFIHPKNKDIYTRYRVVIAITHVGEKELKELTFSVRGGILNDEITITCPAFSAAIGQKGLFLLQKNNNQEIVLVSGNHSFIGFDQLSLTEIEAYRTAIIAVYPQSTPQQIKKSNWWETQKSAAAISITDFAPKVLRAGQREEITITGSGFGANMGVLAFHTPDTEENGFIPVASAYIISWTDSQIKAYVPGSSGIGTGAGSGVIYVQNNSGESTTSNDPLTVLSNKLEIELQGVPLVDDNGNGGITLQYNGNFASNSNAVTAFERALNTWRCHVGFNIEMGTNTSATCNVKDDGVNIVNFDANCDDIPGAGLTSIRFTICGTTGEIFFKEADILMSSTVDWYYGTGIPLNGQLDFESAVLHELGHLLGLWHVLDPQNIMNPQLQTGTTRRGIDDNSLDVALQIANESTAGTTCGDTYPEGMTLLSLSAPSVNISVDSEAYCGNATGSISATANNGNNYLWSNGTTGMSISNLSAGSYSLTVTNNSGCATIKENIVIEQVDGPQSINLTPSDATCGANNGSISVDITGGTMPYTYQWEDNITTKDRANLSADTYKVTVTDANSCTIEGETSVGNIEMTDATVNSNTATCGLANGTASISNISGGLAPYQYEWSNGDKTANIFNLLADVYQVTITDANNCTLTKSVTITGTEALVVIEDISPDYCAESVGGISLNVSGGRMPYTYKWSNGATMATISNLMAANYQVTITDADNCSLTDNFTVTGTSALSSSHDKSNATCGAANGTAQVSVTGGTAPYTYNWEHTNSNESAISDLAAGTYKVTITDIHDCSVQEIITISESSQMQVSVAEMASTCEQDNGVAELVVSGGKSPYSYAWSDNLSNNPMQTNLAAGTYTVTISDADNCKIVESVTIVAIPTITIRLVKEDETCSAGNGTASVTILTGTPPYSYNWEGFPNATDKLNNLTPGTYRLTVTDANNCEASDQITIEGTEPLSVSIVETATTCGEENGSLQTLVAGGTMPYAYTWNNNAIDGAEGSNLAVGNYQVTITDALGCIAEGSTSIASSTAISLTTTQQAETCGLKNGMASVTASGGDGNYTYNWDTGGTASEILGLAAGKYEVTVTDNQNCTATTSIVVDGIAGITEIIFEIDNATCGQANGRLTAIVTGGSPPYAYQWINGAATQSIDKLEVGTYSLTVTDSNGCVLNNSASISNTDGPSATSSATPEICGQANGSITIEVTGGTPPYEWSEDMLENLVAGAYAITISDASGCSIIVEQEVAGVAEPTVTLEPSQSTCQEANGSISATVSNGTPPFTYLWSNDITDAENPNLSAGTYSLTVTDSNGCTAQADTQIVDEGGPQLELVNKQDIICETLGFIEVTHTGGAEPVSYLWSNGVEEAQNNDLTAGAYQVTITDNNGCQTVETYTIEPYWEMELKVTGNFVTSCGENDGSINITLLQGNEPFTYQWEDGTTEPVRRELTGGAYTITITDAKQCTKEATIDIMGRVNPIIEWEADTLTLSVDEPLIVDAGNEGANYLWSTGETSQTIEVNEAAIYSVTVTNADECSTTATVVIQNEVVGWELINAQTQLQYYPNPADQQLTVELQSQQALFDVQCTIYNVTGKKMKEMTKSAAQGKFSQRIDISDLAPGIYFLQVQNDTFRQAYKVIIK